MLKNSLLLPMAITLSIGIGGVNVAMAQATTITMGHLSPEHERSLQHVSSQVFKNIVETRTGGELEVEVFANRQLGRDREAVEMLSAGMIDILFTSDGALAAFAPEIQALSIPYLFPSAPVAWDVIDGPFGQRLKESIGPKVNARVLAVTENGIRHFTNSSHVVRSPADLEGLSIRTMEIESNIRMVEELGGAAVPMSGEEVFSALQQNVIDGQENPLWVIDSFGYTEVQDYLTLDGHLYSVHVLLVNSDFFESLSTEQQNVISEAARALEVTQRGFSQHLESESLSAIVSAGTDVYSPTSEELSQFREASQGPVSEWLAEEIGSEWVDGVIDAVTTAEEGLHSR